MKPTIKTQTLCPYCNSDEVEMIGFGTKEEHLACVTCFKRLDDYNLKYVKWLKLDEEIAWLEEQHKLFAELCNIKFPNGFIEPLRKLILNNAKRLEQLRGGSDEL